jgi:capsule polysaccharide export protein KpsC/LpsZ
MKHPGHTYGGFIPAISEWGMTEDLPKAERRALKKELEEEMAEA